MRVLLARQGRVAAQARYGPPRPHPGRPRTRTDPHSPGREEAIFFDARVTSLEHRRGADFSGSRGETGNHHHAGKMGVMTLAAGPRNQRLSQKPLAFSRGFFVVHGHPCELVGVGRLTFDPARRLKTAFRSVN